MRDADEDILRIKRENKEAINRFRRKMDENEPDKFYAGGLAPLVGEPSYAADFYDDRTPMAGGLLVKLLKKLKSKPKSESKKIDVDALKKKHGLDPESLKKDDEAFKLRLQQILAKHSTKHAEGGRIGLAWRRSCSEGHGRNCVTKLFKRHSKWDKDQHGEGLHPANKRMVQRDNCNQESNGISRKVENCP